MKLSSFDDEETFMEAAGSLHFNNSSSDPNNLRGVHVESSSSVPQEWKEDICFNNPPIHLNSLVSGSSNSCTPRQEKIMV